MIELAKKCLILLVLIFPTYSLARLLQIIHTNDLHSYFAGYENGNGGYARVMTKVKELREKAERKGIDVLQLDAGDWGDGTSFYLSDNGSDSARALEMLGAEVSVIGNHDFELGTKNLRSVITRANVKTKFIGANLRSTDLEGVVTPFVDLNRGGISIRVIGLTTASLFFQYSVYPGKIQFPIPIGENEGKRGKAAGKELVIALTHIGMTQDKLLAKASTSVDLIVGGHSHTKLNDIVWVRNRNGKKVPIVQAWAHGLGVGSLLLDINEAGEVNVLEYKLHEVTSPIRMDPVMVSFIEDATVKRNANLQFDGNEKVGETLTPMTGSRDGHSIQRRSCWGYHMATAAKEATDSAVGLHIAAFEGVWKPAGNVTYADLADNFPHIRKFGDQGWEIATVNIPGWKLKALLFLIKKLNVGVTASGLGYNDLYKVIDLAVSEKGFYRVAFPAEVALGIQRTLPRYAHYLRGLEKSGKFYWPVMVDYLKENSPLKCEGI